ncbi:DUF3034 family protein [Undibacterium parvum]|uniref:DUF3034 family protein n=2 Tax=Undibacterium parvum TaxID=401471 RepID=A0A3Q9BT06_9BURK|nr:DUF3034 family protein [Undibacterium parvum]
MKTEQSMQNSKKSAQFILLAGLSALCQIASAQVSAMPDMGKLTATGGVSQVEGAGGGGLTPWALITGYGSRDSYGGNAHYTQINTQDYTLKTYGVAVGIMDTVEFSLAKQEFSGSLAPLDSLKLKQDILGVKVRVAGEAVYDQTGWLPQIAVGALIKRDDAVGGLGALGVTSVKQLGAKSENGVDYYVSATKLYLAQSLLLNATVRLSKANQMGLLGFGGDKNDKYEPLLEASAAYLINRKLVLGAEYRMKPRNLGVDNEKDNYDVFLAYFPTKNLSVTAAYVNLGDITIFNPTKQRGWYLSLQTGF